VRDAITRYPLVQVLSTLSHQTGNSCSATQSDLNPLAPIVSLSRPRPTVASCHHCVEPRSISTMVIVPLTGGSKGTVGYLAVFYTNLHTIACCRKLFSEDTKIVNFCSNKLCGKCFCPLSPLQRLSLHSKKSYNQAETEERT